MSEQLKRYAPNGRIPTGMVSDDLGDWVKLEDVKDKIDGYYIHANEIVNTVKDSVKNPYCSQSPMELVIELVDTIDESKHDREQIKLINIDLDNFAERIKPDGWGPLLKPLGKVGLTIQHYETEISTLTQRLADVEKTLKHRNAEIKSLASHLESALADKAPLVAALKVCAEYLKEGTIEDRPFHSDAVYATQQALSNSEENDDG